MAYRVEEVRRFDVVETDDEGREVERSSFKSERAAQLYVQSLLDEDDS